MQTNKKRTVVLTGFGLFRDYEANPSWEAVKLVDLRRNDVNLVKLEIPVIYEVTVKEVDRIWSEYKPALVVHCGVSHLATCLTLEKRAVQNVERYCSADVNACKPICERNASTGCEEIEYLYTRIDLDKVCTDINRQFEAGTCPISACISNRAGEYLCEYIYRCSLQKDANRTLFIHVPKASEKSAKEIAQGVEVALESILKQLF